MSDELDKVLDGDEMSLSAEEVANAMIMSASVYDGVMAAPDMKAAIKKMLASPIKSKQMRAVRYGIAFGFVYAAEKGLITIFGGRDRRTIYARDGNGHVAWPREEVSYT